MEWEIFQASFYYVLKELNACFFCASTAICIFYKNRTEYKQKTAILFSKKMQSHSNVKKSTKSHQNNIPKPHGLGRETAILQNKYEKPHK